jgi:hypothetical protein
MVMKNTTDIGGQLENFRAKVTRANVLSWIAVVLAFTGGAYANHLLVLSTDIVNGEVKSVDLATSAVTNSKIAASAVTGAKIAAGAVTGAKIAAGAVTSAKIASNAVTGAKVADGTLTSADIDQSTLEAIDALTLNGSTRNDLSGVGSGGITFVQDLPDCDPGFDYLSRTIIVPQDGFVVVNSLFTAQGPGGVSSGVAVATRIEKRAPSSALGTFGESTVTGPSNRVNISTTDVFSVVAGENTFVLKACDSSDAANGAFGIRARMTFNYSPNLLTSFS